MHPPDPAPDQTGPVAPPAAPPAVASTLGQTPHEPTVRPWELELLISGALVFSVMRLPGAADDWFYSVRPGLDGVWWMASFIGWFYVKLALYAVAVGFALHLCIRAYWVGVIGLEAVFPQGVNWERVRAGPIMREEQRRRMPTLQTLIDRSDRLASMVFAAGLALALLFVFSTLVGAGLAALAFTVSRVLLDGSDAGMVAVEGLVLLWFAPLMLATLLDRFYGHRLDPQGRTARGVRRMARIAVGIQSVALFFPLMQTLFSNLPRGRSTRMAMGVLVMLGAMISARDLVLPESGVHLDSFDFLPDEPGRMGVLAEHYQDRQTEDRQEGTVPEIQSDVVRDPYLRLFIPYRPRVHNRVMPRFCPQVRALGGHSALGFARPRGEAENQVVLRCMAALQPVRINGRPLTPSYHFYTLPGTSARGIVAYIPVAPLPRGENLLEVGRLPVADPSEKPETRPAFAIPFWL